VREPWLKVLYKKWLTTLSKALYAAANRAASPERSQRVMTMRKTKHVVGRIAIATGLGVMLVAVGACGGSSGSAPGAQPPSSSAVGGTLTVAQSIGATTLNPETTNQADCYFEELAYEPLIVRLENGGLAPGLATSWHYAGNGNTTFVMDLRRGVKFSDGTTMTAQDVVNDFEYLLKADGQMAPEFAGDSFAVTGPMQVTITAKTPNPEFPFLLTQDYNAGDIISPNGLKDPAALGTKTFGAGPYELDAAETVSGSVYTYTPNPYYYDKAAVHWKKVVIKVIATAQATLDAMKTGEVNLTQGDPSTLKAAEQAGLTVTQAPLLWDGVVLADRNGKTVKALGSLQVRQALNYDTDRTALARALYAGFGNPTEQVTVPGGYGYLGSLNSTYPYDPTKARQLLAAAGYPHGFTMSMVTADYGEENLLAQALAQEWAQIGVKVNIIDDANTSAYESAFASGKIPSFIAIYGQQPISIEGPGLFLPAALFNPYHTASAALQSLYDQDIRATGAAKTTLDQQVESYLVDNAWFVPVVSTGLPYYATTNITGTEVTPSAPLVELYQVEPARS
jgi:peptide/nickel transport system substrate-binding protein